MLKNIYVTNYFLLKISFKMTTHTLIQMEELPLEKTLKLSNFYTWGEAGGKGWDTGPSPLPAASISRRPSVRRKQHPGHL